MPTKTRLTDEERGRILALHEEGLAQRSIAQRVGRSQNAVNNVINLGDDYGKKNPGGRPTKMTAQDRRRLFREARTTGRSSTTLKNELQLSVSARTIRRELNRSRHFKFEAPQRTFFRTDSHKKLRQDWGEEMVQKDDF